MKMDRGSKNKAKNCKINKLSKMEVLITSSKKFNKVKRTRTRTRNHLIAKYQQQMMKCQARNGTNKSTIKNSLRYQAKKIFASRKIVNKLVCHH